MKETLESTNSIKQNAGTIQDLKKAIVNARKMIAYCLKHMADAEKQLRSYLATRRTPKNRKYLSSSILAYEASIVACLASIKAFYDDIESYENMISSILGKKS